MNEEIIKVCKKHGELKKEESYSYISYKNKIYYKCIYCIRINHSNNEIIRRTNGAIKRKLLLNDKSISKKCKRHGLIKKENIRIDLRGTIICRICDRDNRKKYISENLERHNKVTKEWRLNNKDKLRKYYQNSKPKRMVRLKQKQIIKNFNKEYKKPVFELKKTCNIHGILNENDIYVNRYMWKTCRLCRNEKHKIYVKNNSGKVKEQSIKSRIKNKEKLLINQREKSRKEIELLKDVYVKSLLLNRGKSILNRNDIPQNLVDAKRALILLKRGIKEKIK